MQHTPEMTEREKMISGLPYDPQDPELVEARKRASELCERYNKSHARQKDLRQRILEELLGSVGEKVEVKRPFHCEYGTNIFVGNEALIQKDCVIVDACPVKIGNNVLIQKEVKIYTVNRPPDNEVHIMRETGRPIEIDPYVAIGEGSVICPGVHIGSQSIIWASVVTEDIPEQVVAYGNPSRVIASLDDDEDEDDDEDDEVDWYEEDDLLNDEDEK